jgi:tight adherence protein C
MIPLQTLLVVCGAASLFMMGGALLMLRAVSHQKRIDQRIASVRAGRVRGRRPAIKARRLLRFVSGVGAGILRSGMLSSQAIDELTHKLAIAGIRTSNAIGIFIGFKILLLISLPSLTFITLHGLISLTFLRNAIVVGATIMGLLLPDMCLGFLRKRYQAALDRGLPDALDMMVMCAESGLSLEPTIARVGTEIEPAHPQIARELLLTSQELQMSSDSHVVLNNFGERTDLTSVRRVCSTLSQTLQYGTPLSDALRVLSAEMRQEMLTRFEERAARLPVLLTVPMILFILPSLFLVVGGPAIMQVLNLMRH